jgi:hypothetical protein
LRYLILFLTLAGCGGGVAYMKEVERPAALRAPKDAAMVVFVRPSWWAAALQADVVDEQGRFIGRTAAKAHFTAVVPPGRHTFVVWGENTDAVQIEGAAGHIYFVEVGPTMGWWSARFHLRAISPRTASWAQRDRWMASTTYMRADTVGGQNLLAGREQDVDERLRRACEHLQQYWGTPEQPDHFMAASDGI